MRKLLVLLLPLQLLLINRLSAQIDSSNILEVPLMTKVALKNVSSGVYKIYYRGKFLKVSKGKNAKIFIRPNQSAVVGVSDTLLLIRNRDTTVKVFKIIKPLFEVRFDNFNDHSSSDIFLRLNPPQKILINILNLDDSEVLLNKVSLKEATFCLYNQDSLMKAYKVNNFNLKEMFSDLRRKYRPGYYLSLSEISVLINNEVYQSKEEYFRYLFK